MVGAAGGGAADDRQAFGAAASNWNGQSTTPSFTLTNLNPGRTLTGVGFTDALPLGLTVVNGTNATCGGTADRDRRKYDRARGPRSRRMGPARFRRPTGDGRHQAQRHDASPRPGRHGLDRVGDAHGRRAGGGGAAADDRQDLRAEDHPVERDDFLTFRLTNPNPALLSGVAFTDPPDGLVVATPTRSRTCGGAAIAVDGEATWRSPMAV